MTQHFPESEDNHESDQQLFQIHVVQGRGRGLVACLNIAKGTRILTEKPLFVIPKVSQIDLMESNIATKLKSLSKDQQRQFFSLHNNFPGKHPFSGIVNTNALPCGPDSVIGGIYPNICLINHTCLSNAHNNWNDDTSRETIHALRNINAGEEITICYDKGSLFDPRRARLKSAFGIDCTCTLCSLQVPERQMSDARRLQIQHLDDAIGNPDRVMNKPDECLADCHTLLQVLEAEYKDSAVTLFARAYYDALQICITHSDQARASVFAERGYQCRILIEGEDSPATLKLKDLKENPARHRNFGTSSRWKTAKRLVPKGLEVSMFEEWLWKRGR